MTSPDFRTKIEECEKRIREGKGGAVASILSTVNVAKLPNAAVVQMANIYRRSGLPQQALKILTPLVRDHRGRLNTAAHAELAEYAGCLRRIGSLDEALSILSSLPANDLPDTLLYRAFCLFNSWEYEKAIPLLIDYGHTPLSPYKKLVGDVNLAAAYLACDRREEAEAILNRMIEDKTLLQFTKLRGNSFEMRAQLHLLEGRYTRAKEDLSHATRLLTDSDQSDQLYTRKWSAIIEARESQDPRPLDQVRREATEHRDWESLRHLDLHAIMISFDQDVFDKQIAGTPFEAYRKHVCEALGRTRSDQQYCWGERRGSSLNIATGEVDGCGTDITKPTAKILQMLTVLSQNLYAPRNLGAVFASLYPGEHFDIFSSPNRIHQVISRTRDWLTQAEVPLVITEEKGLYKMQLSGPFCVLLPINRAPAAMFERHLAVLKSALPPGNQFNSSEAKQLLGISQTSFVRFASWARENGKLERSGSGNSVVYRWSA